MDKQQIKEAAAKASEDYMENTLIMSGPRGSYRKGFIDIRYIKGWRLLDVKAVRG